MQQLLDAVVEDFLEPEPSVLNALVEVERPLAKELKTLIQRFDVLLRYWVDFDAFFEDLEGTLWHLGVHLTELVAGPFDAVESLFWEHFQRADRDFVVDLGIFLRGIRFCLVGEDDLNVPLGSESATFEEGRLRGNAPAVDVNACLHVVKGVSDEG